MTDEQIREHLLKALEDDERREDAIIDVMDILTGWAPAAAID